MHASRRVTLQWGHRFTSVETEKNEKSLLTMRKASMGPPIYIGGNRDILIMQLFKIRYASMGPPIYIGGNLREVRRRRRRE